MNNPLQDGMEEATRLTREGRLAEATAAIQRALRGGSDRTPDVPVEPLERMLRSANEAPRVSALPRPEPEEHNLRRAPKLSRGFRGMTHLPTGLSGAMPGVMERVPAPAAVPAGGRFVERSYTGRAGTRAYKLYIPSGYAAQQEAPLVVMLHGCTQAPDDFAVGTGMNVLAEEHTFLVAYPAQAAGANSSKCWNWFKAADQQRGRGEPSIIAGITREVLGEYRVDARRVYVAGMSAGGAMAAILGSTYPDLYAAVGVHSGLAPGAAHDLSSAFGAMRSGGAGAALRYASTGEPVRAVPVISFHGDRDTTVHPRNADHLLAHYRVSGDPASPARVHRGQAPGGHAYTRVVHPDADGRAITEQWTVHGLGHAWSGGNSSGSYTDSRGPDASAEMASFFRQHRGPEPMDRPAG
jgi:poly(hydroxyalkanoate) depolymerase family esterase